VFADAPAAPAARPCDSEPAKSLPFCDSTLDRDTRINDIINRLSSADKVNLFSNGAT
jgi:hypothetical protein